MTVDSNPWRFCVAPMMAWTDNHCRHLHRLLSREARLYTEMVTTGALLHGDVAAHLDFGAEQQPLALQLGGSEPDDLAKCAKLAERWGYAEVNLNCGCPSERVQRGAFGACLMQEPQRVRECVAAMVDAVSLPVTVKHRIGVDRIESYDFVRDFIGCVAQGGARVFIVHARNAWLDGLSPKDNREIPPLRYEFAYRLKQDFSDLTIVVNGGIDNWPAAAGHLDHVDGVMVGRRAYQDPWSLASVDGELFGRASNRVDDLVARVAMADALADYAQRVVAGGEPLRNVTRHALGLFNGLPGARQWRRLLSDASKLAGNDPALIREAAQRVVVAHRVSRGGEGELRAAA